jgi:hypothetical protein
VSDWWLWAVAAVAYVAMIVAISIRWHLSVSHTLLVGLLPILWPVFLPVYLVRRAMKGPGGPPAPTSSDA